MVALALSCSSDGLSPGTWEGTLQGSLHPKKLGLGAAWGACLWQFCVGLCPCGPCPLSEPLFPEGEGKGEGSPLEADAWQKG